MSSSVGQIRTPHLDSVNQHAKAINSTSQGPSLLMLEVQVFMKTVAFTARQLAKRRLSSSSDLIPPINHAIEAPAYAEDKVPYINLAIGAVLGLARSGVCNVPTLQAALLHSVGEVLKIQDIAQMFGNDVSILVEDCRNRPESDTAQQIISAEKLYSCTALSEVPDSFRGPDQHLGPHHEHHRDDAHRSDEQSHPSTTKSIMSWSEFVSLLDALDFAAQRHTTQRRIDPERTPYINHPIGVAMTLTSTGVCDLATLQAAILHDTLEDTRTTAEEIKHKFGGKVMNIVKECTDDKSLSKTERKAAQVDESGDKSDAAKQVKMSDKYYNCRDLLRAPPHGWTPQRIIDYLKWSKTVTDQCSHVNKALSTRLNAFYKSAHVQIDDEGTLKKVFENEASPQDAEEVNDSCSIDDSSSSTSSSSGTRRRRRSKSHVQLDDEDPMF